MKCIVEDVTLEIGVTAIFLGSIKTGIKNNTQNEPCGLYNGVKG